LTKIYLVLGDGVMGLRNRWAIGSAVAAAVVLMASPAMAAGLPGASAMPVAAMPQWVFQAFDYFVLALLGFASIAGVALVIDAMIHVREIKIAPPETTEHLRS